MPSIADLGDQKTRRDSAKRVAEIAEKYSDHPIQLNSGFTDTEEVMEAARRGSRKEFDYQTILDSFREVERFNLDEDSGED